MNAGLLVERKSERYMGRKEDVKYAENEIKQGQEMCFFFEHVPLQTYVKVLSEKSVIKLLQKSLISLTRISESRARPPFSRIELGNLLDKSDNDNLIP